MCWHFQKQNRGNQENQAAGSIFTQIDTRVLHSVDFMPVDLFNRCTARVLSTIPNGQQPTVTFTPYNQNISTIDQSVGFEDKLERPLQLSCEEGSRQRRSLIMDGNNPQLAPVSTGVVRVGW